MKTAHCFNGSAPQRRGMALVAVLWIVAALSVMARALAGTARVQLRAGIVQRDAASGVAAGQAAVALALQEMLAQTERPRGQVLEAQIQWQDTPVQVHIAPLSGLLGLARIRAETLTALLQAAAGLPADAAEALAQAAIDWREGADIVLQEGQRRIRRRFEAVEDLMLVPGMDYAIYSRIAPLLTVEVSGATVDPRTAPPEVLYALAPGQQARVAAYLAQRSQPGADASFFDPALVGERGGTGNLYRLHVHVPLGEGTILRLVSDVALRTDSARRLPWVVLRESWQIAAATTPPG